MRGTNGPEDTREAVLTMTVRGLNPRTIAIALGVTTQAVYYHLKALRESGELPPKEGAA